MKWFLVFWVFHQFGPMPHESNLGQSSEGVWVQVPSQEACEQIQKLNGIEASECVGIQR